MPDPTFKQVKDLFLEVIEVEPDERAGWLEARCGASPVLRSRVEELLAADAPTVDRSPFPESQTPTALDDLVDGKYLLVRRLGEGGFGVVYEAERENPLQRVALKLIRPGRDSSVVLSRFEQERQTLAVMDHPGIARVLDGGTTERGHPYFVMELVEGVPITTFCSKNGLDLVARLELFLSVCDAVQHAHMKGIIHRDLTPRNILVGEVDGQHVVKVIDFGIAKALRDHPGLDRVNTAEGSWFGTPEFMSPEQTRGGGEDIDTRADVYALGAVLYQMLSDHSPYEGTTLQAALDSRDYAEIQRLIRDTTPTRPSSRLSMKLGDSGTPEDRRRRTALATQLDWVIMRCLEKERDRRYGSVGELAAEIERFLTDRPVLAGAPGTMYRLSKFVRRNRLLVGAGAIVGLALVGLFVALVYGLNQAGRAVEQAELASESRADYYESSIEQSVSRGDWKAVSDGIERMEAESLEIPSEIRLRAIESRLVLGGPRTTTTLIEDLESLELEDALEAKRLLLTADILLSGSRTGRDPELLVRQALELETLGVSDEAYAQGIISQTAPEAIAHLERAVKGDVFHTRAAQLMVMLQMFSGRFEEADHWLVLLTSLSPEDPRLLSMQVMRAALQGDAAASARMLEKLKERSGPEGYRAVSLQNEVLLFTYESARKVSRDEPVSAMSTAMEVLKLLQAFGVEAGRASLFDLDVLDIANGLALVPALKNGILTGLVADFTPLMPAAEKLPMLQAAYEAHPEGLRAFMYADALRAVGENQRASDLYRLAADEPSFLPIPRHKAVYLSVLCENQEIQSGRLRFEDARNHQWALTRIREIDTDDVGTDSLVDMAELGNAIGAFGEGLRFSAELDRRGHVLGLRITVRLHLRFDQNQAALNALEKLVARDGLTSVTRGLAEQVRSALGLEGSNLARLDALLAKSE